MILDGAPKKGEKEKSTSRVFQIDDYMYAQVVYLSKYIYDLSATQIITRAIEAMIRDDSVHLYKVDYQAHFTGHSLRMKTSIFEQLASLQEKYPAVSLNTLVNIAIFNLLEEEQEHLAGFDREHA